MAYEVKKRKISAPYKTMSANFESSWLKTFALQIIEVLGNILVN
jgi:hypothetical protein